MTTTTEADIRTELAEAIDAARDALRDCYNARIDIAAAIQRRDAIETQILDYLDHPNCEPAKEAERERQAAIVVVNDQSQRVRIAKTKAMPALHDAIDKAQKLGPMAAVELDAAPDGWVADLIDDLKSGRIALLHGDWRDRLERIDELLRARCATLANAPPGGVVPPGP